MEYKMRTGFLLKKTVHVSVIILLMTIFVIVLKFFIFDKLILVRKERKNNEK